MANVLLAVLGILAAAYAVLRFVGTSIGAAAVWQGGAIGAAAAVVLGLVLGWRKRRKIAAYRAQPWRDKI